MGGSASSSPAVQKSLANFMDAAMSTTVDGLRSTGKRIKKGNAALSDAMSDAYDEVNLLDPARQIGLTSQGRGDPSVMRSINTPLVAGAQMGLGAANAAYRGTANLLGQGVEGVRSVLPKSLSDYVGTGAQFERDFNAMPEFLAGTGFGLIPGVGPRLAGGFTEGTAARNAERGMVKLTDDLPMDEASKIKLSAAEEYNAASYLDGTGPDYKINDLLDADDNFVPGKSRALYKALEKMGVRVDGYPGGGTSDYFTINVLDKNNPLDEFGESNFNEFKIRVADHGNTTNKYNQPDINVSPHNNSLNEAIDKLYDLVKSNQVKMVKPTNNLPMDEASRMARADEMFPEKGYFGRNNDFSSFEGGHWIADDPKIAGHYAKRAWAKDELSHADELDGGEFTDVDNINPYDLETSYTPSAENIIPLRYNKGKTLSLEHLGDNPTLESLFDDLSKKGIVDKPSVNELDDFIDETDLTTDSALWRKIQELGIDQDIRKAGYDSYSITDAVVAKNGTIPHRSTFVFDPKKSRSRFAKFDPKNRDSSNLLAAGLPLSAFVGERDDTPYDRLKRKFKGAK